MTSQELTEYVGNELELNPFLEAQDSYEALSSSEKDDKPMDLKDAGWQEESYLRYEKSGSNDNSYGTDNFENADNKTGSLREHLITQIGIEFSDNKEKIAAIYITDILDQNGYLTESIETIAKLLSCEVKFLKSILSKLYKLDPVGSYAQSLSDCLLIQLSEKGLLTKKFKLLLDHLDDIPKGEIKKICKECSITKEEFFEMMSVIKDLDPKPGRNFSIDSVRTMIPDAFINFNEKKELVVSLNSQSLPKIYVNTKYFQNIISHSKGGETKKFCNEKLNSANWLIKSIHQRSETLVNVCNQIAKRQYEFFEKGINYLQPMTLSDIAQKVQMHESTISRISNKVVSTPLGVYEIKFFFNNALNSNYSENKVSTLSVKQKLKEIVEAECSTTVLSDDEIAEELQKIGISISRRTVAKYRDKLEIPPSNIRKRVKSISNA